MMEIKFINEKENTINCDGEFYEHAVLLAYYYCWGQQKNTTQVAELVMRVLEKSTGKYSNDYSPVSAEDAYAIATALEHALAHVPDGAICIDAENLYKDRVDLPNEIVLTGEEDSDGDRAKFILPVQSSHLAQSLRILLVSLSGKKMELNRLISFLKQGAYQLV